jgi:sec-independent protein translocase protein TatB
MFDFGVGYTEMFLIAVVAIIVIGPKELPAVLRTLGRSLAKMRGMAREFQGHLDSAMKESGLDEVKKEFNNLKNINPIETVKKDIVSDVKKQEDDFKKLFGDAPAETPKPAASAGAAPT